MAKGSTGTPATRLLDEEGCDYSIHRYQHNPRSESYGLEAAQALGVTEDDVYKTLVVETDRGFAVAVLPVSHQLSLKAFAAAAGAKRAKLAELSDVVRLTGYVAGGVSPIGQRRALPTVVDDSARNKTGIYVSGGRRGLDIRLKPGDLVELLQARYARLTAT
ncbi:Cys-tRNA(Pro) deacylase [Tessaracoccus sp. OH4464_COT-324]|uniref:Cys-tRNA(Pro) deacylase n=1 Tax=Tessaracoccus sp. OH4464_COT-324 TaxID=2491059 RepID=UPI000F639AC8|nr:Cys-tRNA(Pro) deacylase [Tessaracoccus sp. OH4464_COT-324]RRD46119.1 Cys-tRNA(Pro) deacylase [Tessaracoccus sp. OH4464_COT-324]